MTKFECRVERIDKYRVEFDESIINEEWMEDFRSFMYDFYTLDEHAEHIAQHRARHGGRFIEGYGYLLEDGKVPYWVTRKDQDKVNKGINIITISEDREISIDVN